MRFVLTFTILLALLAWGYLHWASDGAPDPAEPARMPLEAPPEKPAERPPVLRASPAQPAPQPHPEEPEAPPVAARAPLAQFVVVDAKSRATLEAARVSVSASWIRVVREAPGSFALHGEGLSLPFSLSVRIEAAGHLPLGLSLEPGSDFPKRVALQPAGVVRGLVVSETGEPVARASVRVALREVQADEAGRFECGPVPLATDLRPSAKSPLGRSLPHPAIRLDAGSPEALITLTIAEGRVHVVEVQENGGVPVPAAWVILEFADRRFPPIQVEARTGPDGRAILRGLRVGSFVLLAGAQGFDGAKPTPLDIEEEAGTDRTTVVLQRSYVHSVGGTVTDPAGVPLPGVRLHVWVERGRKKLKARSDARGRFRIEGVPHGFRRSGIGEVATEAVARTYAQKKGWAAPSVYDLPLDRDITIVMARPGGVKGRVLDPNGRPVSNLSLMFHPDDVGLTSVMADPFQRLPEQGNDIFKTTSDGRFSSRKVMAVPGSLSIGERAGSGERLKYAPLSLRLEVVPGETIDLGDVVLPRRPDARLRGRILSEAPVSNDDLRASIRLFAREDGKIRGGASVADGRYDTGSKAPAGTYDVLFLRDGYVSDHAAVTLGKRETTELDLVVWRAGSIRVEVEGAGADHEVRLHYRGRHVEAFRWRSARRVRRERAWFVEHGEAPSVLPIEPGHGATFETLPPGLYELELLRGVIVEASARVELVEGEQRVPRLIARGSGGTK